MQDFDRPINISKLDYDERMYVYGASRISLCQEENGKLGRDYLLRERGLDWDTIAKFRFGFVPYQQNHLFSGRVVIPIFDMYDKLLVLSVRPSYKILKLKNGNSILATKISRNGSFYNFCNTDNTIDSIEIENIDRICDGTPKYWNETFAKGENLFALNLAKYSIAKNGFAILVEGQMDVASFHSYGITNTVGLLGGSFTHIHAMLLKRWTRQIVIIMDGDVAGRKHAEKINEILKVYSHKYDSSSKKYNTAQDVLRYNILSCNINLPDGTDPDTFVRKYGSYTTKQHIITSMLSSRMTIPKEWD